MQTITTIGLDLAKSVFQVHGVDAAGQVVIRRQLKRQYVLAFSEVAAMPDWHRGLRFIALLVTRAPGTGSHCTTDAAGLREALRQAAKVSVGLWLA